MLSSQPSLHPSSSLLPSLAFPSAFARYISPQIALGPCDFTPLNIKHNRLQVVNT